VSDDNEKLRVSIKKLRVQNKDLKSQIKQLTTDLGDLKTEVAQLRPLQTDIIVRQTADCFLDALIKFSLSRNASEGVSR